jgi:hypothetical protein
MSQEKFSRREVERSFRKFNDIVNDLIHANFRTWGNVFTHLITHCENDPVMQVITGPLKTNKNVDAEEWYKEALNSVGGMIGSGRYELPYDDEDRTALLYQFFLMFEENKVDFMAFCLGMYGTSRYQDAVDTFNRELTEKFTREISYRLDEIRDDLGDQQEVPREAMMVFHHHDYSLNIQGNVQGSNIATGGSTISNSTAEYTNHEELASALKSLKPIINEVSAGQRESAEMALQLLIQATHDPSISTEQVAEATRTISVNSPTMGERLKGIAGKVGLSLVSSSIFQGIKIAFGL